MFLFSNAQGDSGKKMVSVMLWYVVLFCATLIGYLSTPPLLCAVLLAAVWAEELRGSHAVVAFGLCATVWATCTGHEDIHRKNFELILDGGSERSPNE